MSICSQFVVGVVSLAVSVAGLGSPIDESEEKSVAARSTGAFVDHSAAAERVAIGLDRHAPEVVVSTSPDGRALEAVQVGQPVWFTDTSAWSSTVTATTPEGVTVTVTATVDRIRWLAGDGAVVMCTTPNTFGLVQWQHRTWWGSSFGCGHTYSTSSLRTGGTYLVTAIAEWSATWQTSDGHSGPLDLSSKTGMASLRVADAIAHGDRGLIEGQK